MANEPMTLLYIVCADTEEATAISRALLDARLIACVNIHPIISMYWWQGKMENASEVVVLAKTLARASLLQAIEATVRRLHSYAVPCILQLPVVGVNADYYAWLTGEVMKDE